MRTLEIAALVLAGFAIAIGATAVVVIQVAKQVGSMMSNIAKDLIGRPEPEPVNIREAVEQITQASERMFEQASDVVPEEEELPLPWEVGPNGSKIAAVGPGEHDGL